METDRSNVKVDRELLELAAKAVGVAPVLCYESARNCLRIGDRKGYALWRPITDDGDALRLAVALRLTIYHDELAVIIKHKRYSWEWMGEMVDEDSGDRNSATRRAIVRSAAAIGEQMP